MDPLQRLLQSIQCKETYQAEQILLDQKEPISTFRLNSRDATTGQTALHLCAKFGNERILSLILSRGDEVNVNIADTVHCLTPLILACREGHVDIVSSILKMRKDCDVNLCDSKGSSALHFASVKGPLEIVKLLVQHGAQIDKKNHYGNSALHRAASANALEIIKLLVDYFRDMQQKGNSSSALPDLQSLIEAENNDGQRIIHFASLNGSANVVKYLVQELKADLEAGDKNLVTPLHVSTENAHEEVVEILLLNNANVNSQDLSNETALMKAAYKGYLNIVKKLTAFNANLNLQERASGMTALMFAALHSQDEIVEYLVEQGADIHIQNHENKTALHFACAQDSVDVVELLLKNGADPSSAELLHNVSDRIRELLLEAQKRKRQEEIMNTPKQPTRPEVAASTSDKKPKVGSPRVPRSTRSQTNLSVQPPPRTSTTTPNRSLAQSMHRSTTPSTPLSAKKKLRPASATPSTPRHVVRKRSGSHSSREDSVGKSTSRKTHTPPHLTTSQKASSSDSSTTEVKKKKVKRHKKKVSKSLHQSSLTKKKLKAAKKVASSGTGDDSASTTDTSPSSAKYIQEEIESPLGDNSDESLMMMDSPRLVVTQQEDTMNDMIGGAKRRPATTHEHHAPPQHQHSSPNLRVATTLAESMRQQREQQHLDPINTHLTAQQRKLYRLQSLTPTEKLFTWSEVGVTLGRGAFGEVILAITENGSLIAVKRLSVSNANWKRVEKEVSLLQRLEHQHICRYLGCQLSEDGCSTLDILLEYCSEGTLNSFMKQIKRASTRIRSLQIYMRQILMGLSYIHNLGLLHRDIKPDNILIHSSGLCKLADFGCSKILSDSLSRVSQQGTPEFFSPELIKDEVPKGFEKGIDIWALGVVTWELACGRSIWHEPELGWSGTNRFQLMFKIANLTSDPVLPQRLKLQSLRDFVQCCLRLDARERPSVDQLLKHPFLHDKSFHNMQDNAILAPVEGESTRGPVVNLLDFASTETSSFGDGMSFGGPSSEKCLESMQSDESLCRMDSVIL